MRADRPARSWWRATIPGSCARSSTCSAPSGSTSARRRSSACPSRRRPARPSRRTPSLKARAAAQARHAGAGRRFRPGGRCARRRAGRLHGALGRADQGFRHRHAQGRGRARRPPAPTRRSGAARTSSAALSLARPTDEVETFAGQVDGTLVWPPRGDLGFRLRPDVHARRARPHVRRDERRGEARLAPRPARALSHRARAFMPLRDAIAWTQGHAVPRKPDRLSASTSTGRSAPPNAPIAISTRMSAINRRTSRALSPPSRARSAISRR